MVGKSASSRHRYGVLVLGAFSYTCLTFVWFSLPAYLPTLIDEMGLSGLEAGILAGAVPLTYIPFALFSGLVVDSVGPLRSLAAGLCVFGLAQVGRSFASGFPSLLVCTLLVGVGGMAITFGLPKLVSVLFPPSRTGLPSSLYLVGSSAGTAGAFALGKPLLGPALGGWRPLFFWSGVVSVAYGAVMIGATRLASVSRDRSDTESGGMSLRSDLRAILTHSQLRLVVVVGTMYLLLFHGMQGWLPTILEARGLGSTVAGRTASLLVVANVCGVLAVPALADRFAARRKAISVSGAVVLCGLAALLLGGIGGAMVGGVVATGFGIGGLSPLVRAIPPNLDGIGPARTGTAVGFVFAVGEAGGFLGPVLIGSVHDATGSFAPGLLALVCAAAVVVLTGILLRDV